MSALQIAVVLGAVLSVGEPELTRIKFNHPGLIVDLGVGLWAWPLPMDYDGDGDLDLVVSCPDVPYNGTYLFENTDGRVKDPVFQPARRIGDGFTNIQVSDPAGKPRVLVPGAEFVDFLTQGFSKRKKLPVDPKVHSAAGRIRANQWKYSDVDGDSDLDLIVGIEDWTDYGWDDAYDKQGNWTHGPLRGFVYLLKNEGDPKKPRYTAPVKLLAAGSPIDGFGMPSPNLADFDGDGDLDLICGEFLDQFTYYENVGSKEHLQLAKGRRLTHQGRPLAMDLEMIVPAAVDWDFDGDVDLVVGQEDGRVALVEHTGKIVDGSPSYLPPKFFRQKQADLKFGALATPVGVDWDSDGDEDLLCGNTAGYIGFLENLGGNPPKWAQPKLLEADGKTIRIEAGKNGSIQGPCEAKWGYTTLSAADWNGDGLADLMVNSIWGEVLVFINVGSKSSPKLAEGRPLEVEWPAEPPKPAWNWWSPKGKQLVTQWRTTPFMIDWNRDGLMDLVMLDHEGYLALFQRSRHGDALKLAPGRRIFRDEKGTLLRLNERPAGKSGRRKFTLVDWDQDGRVDLLLDGRNCDFYRNVADKDGETTLQRIGPLASTRLAGHDASPTTVDWDKDGVRDLLIGAEDGRFYFLRNPKSVGTGRSAAAHE
jgi:hypothetical protein